MSKLHIVYEQDPIFIRYISDRLGVDYNPTGCKTISHVKENDDGTFTILAVVLYSRFAKHHCELSIASDSPMWATWNFIHAVYEYGFADGRQRLNIVSEPDNQRVLDMHKKLGHVEEGYLHDVYGRDKDGILFGYTRQMWEKSKWYYRKRRTK